MEKKHYAVDTNSTNRFGNHVGTRHTILANSRAEAKAQAKLKEKQNGHKLQRSPIIKNEW